MPRVITFEVQGGRAAIRGVAATLEMRKPHLHAIKPFKTEPKQEQHVA
jgi:hypothetical protein